MFYEPRFGDLTIFKFAHFQLIFQLYVPINFILLAQDNFYRCSSESLSQLFYFVYSQFV